MPPTESPSPGETLARSVSDADILGTHGCLLLKETLILKILSWKKVFLGFFLHLFWLRLNWKCFIGREKVAFRLSQVVWFPLKYKPKDSNTIIDPRSCTCKFTQHFLQMAGSEEPGRKNWCKIMFLIWFWWHNADGLWICLQRYSVAVYLVRVFTAADLFSQLKLCSVESAERCRERSKCRSRTPAQ